MKAAVLFCVFIRIDEAAPRLLHLSTYLLSSLSTSPSFLCAGMCMPSAFWPQRGGSGSSGALCFEAPPVGSFIPVLPYFRPFICLGENKIAVDISITL